MKQLSASKVMLIVMAMYAVKVIIKYYVGTYAQSAAMVGDAYHGSSDIAAATVVLMAAQVAKYENPRFNYGLHKVESLLGVVVGGLLAYVAWTVLLGSVVSILSAMPSYDSAVRALVSLPAYQPVKMGSAYWPWVVAASLLGAVISWKAGNWEVGQGRKLGSDIIVSDGQETKGDGFVELGVAASAIAVNYFKVPWMDGVASLIIVFFIASIAFEIIWSGVKSLLLESIGSDVTDALKAAILRLPGVVDAVKFRSFFSGATAVVNIKVISRCPPLAERDLKKAIEAVTQPVLASHEISGSKFYIRFAQPPEERHRVAIAVTRRGQVSVVAETPEAATHVYIADVEDGQLKRVTAHRRPADFAAFIIKKETVRQMVCLAPQASTMTLSVPLVAAPHWSLASLGV